MKTILFLYFWLWCFFMGIAQYSEIRPNHGVSVPQFTTAFINNMIDQPKGTVVFDKDLNLMKYWDGSLWQNMSGWGTGVGWQINGNNISNTNSANVGIGTQLPASKLDINGDIAMGSTELLINNFLVTALDVNTLKQPNYLLKSDPLSNITSEITLVGITGGVAGRIITLINQTNRNIIIGSPTAFTVANNDRIHTGLNPSFGPPSNFGLPFTIYNGGTVTLRYDATNQYWLVINTNNTDLSRQLGDWQTYGSDIYNKNSGNVGIGVNIPSAKLEVNGSFKLTDGSQGSKKVLTSDANGLASWQTNTNNIKFGYEIYKVSSFTSPYDFTYSEVYNLNASNVYILNPTVLKFETAGVYRLTLMNIYHRSSIASGNSGARYVSLSVWIGTKEYKIFIRKPMSNSDSDARYEDTGFAFDVFIPAGSELKIKVSTEGDVSWIKEGSGYFFGYLISE